MNRSDFEEEMKDPKYGDIDRMHYIIQSDPSKMMHTRKVEYELYQFKEKFQEHVHDLIKLRNRIFNTQLEFKRIDNPKRAGLEPRNVAKFLELSASLENKEDYSIFSLFKIGRKKSKKNGNLDHTLPSESYDEEEIALTDTDEENEEKPEDRPLPSFSALLEKL